MVNDQYQAFKQVLGAVVFSNHRNGALRVELGHYILRSARTGREVDEDNWQHLVKEGAHISQTMIVYGKQVKQKKYVVSKPVALFKFTLSLLRLIIRLLAISIEVQFF